MTIEILDQTTLSINGRVWQYRPVGRDGNLAIRTIDHDLDGNDSPGLAVVSDSAGNPIGDLSRYGYSVRESSRQFIYTPGLASYPGALGRQQSRDLYRVVTPVGCLAWRIVGGFVFVEFGTIRLSNYTQNVYRITFWRRESRSVTFWSVTPCYNVNHSAYTAQRANDDELSIIQTVLAAYCALVATLACFDCAQTIQSTRTVYRLDRGNYSDQSKRFRVAHGYTLPDYTLSDLISGN